MKVITGAGVAGLLMIAGGTPVAALSQDASSGASLGATSTVATTDQESTDSGAAESEGTKAEQTEAEETAVPEVETAETDDSTDAGSALGQAHAAAMKIWARCVAEAASGPKVDGQLMPPKLACGAKPLAPGRIKQLTQPAEAETATDTEDSAQVEAEDGSAAPGWAGNHGWGQRGQGHHGHGNGHGNGGHGHHG